MRGRPVAVGKVAALPAERGSVEEDRGGAASGDLDDGRLGGGVRGEGGLEGDGATRCLRLIDGQPFWSAHHVEVSDDGERETEAARRFGGLEQVELVRACRQGDGNCALIPVAFG